MNITKDKIAILIIALVLVLAWISADFLFPKPTIPPSPEIQKALEPVDPAFDEAAVRLIKDLNITNKPLEATAPATTPTPVPQPTPKPATPSAALTPATPSATITPQ
jgi:hypothetical protein